MANPNAAYGLIPVRHMSGNSHTCKQIYYHIWISREYFYW